MITTESNQGQEVESVVHAEATAVQTAGESTTTDDGPPAADYVFVEQQSDGAARAEAIVRIGGRATQWLGQNTVRGLRGGMDIPGRVVSRLYRPFDKTAFVMDRATQDIQKRLNDERDKIKAAADERTLEEIARSVTDFTGSYLELARYALSRKRIGQDLSADSRKIIGANLVEIGMPAHIIEKILGPKPKEDAIPVDQVAMRKLRKSAVGSSLLQSFYTGNEELQGAPHEGRHTASVSN